MILKTIREFRAYVINEIIKEMEDYSSKNSNSAKYEKELQLLKYVNNLSESDLLAHMLNSIQIHEWQLSDGYLTIKNYFENVIAVEELPF